MPALRISVTIAGPPPELSPLAAPSLMRYGERAEALGFHALYLTDHFLHQVPTLHSGSALAVLAAATERVRLGFSAYVLPLRHPVAAAKELAMLDGLSSGRLIPGFAVGSQAPEFAACGIPFSERGRRLDEGIAAVRALWTEPSASFSGRFYAFENVRLEPKPVQRPHPPIWIGSWSGTRPAALRVARLAAGWQGSGLFTSIAETRAAKVAIDAACVEIGRDPSTLGRAFVNATTSIAGTTEAALAALPAMLRGHPDRCLAGTPDDVIAKLSVLADSGIDEVALLFPSWSLPALETVSREVMPAFAATVP